VTLIADGNPILPRLLALTKKPPKDSILYSQLTTDEMHGTIAFWEVSVSPRAWGTHALDSLTLEPGRRLINVFTDMPRRRKRLATCIAGAIEEDLKSHTSCQEMLAYPHDDVGRCFYASLGFIPDPKFGAFWLKRL
jgi:hypothetical protein